MDILALYTSIPHYDGIAATASVLNTTNCQFPDAILHLIHFILDHNIFAFDDLFFIQTHRTAMGTRFASHYANIFVHSFHPKPIKTAIPYGQALCTHRICLNEEERDRHLKVLKDALIGTGYSSIAHSDVPQRKTVMTSSEDRRGICLIGKLPRLLGNIDHNTIQPCHGNLCKTFQIFDVDTTITRGNTPTRCME
eukprot:g40912.t1